MSKEEGGERFPAWQQDSHQGHLRLWQRKKKGDYQDKSTDLSKSGGRQCFTQGVHSFLSNTFSVLCSIFERILQQNLCLCSLTFQIASLGAKLHHFAGEIIVTLLSETGFKKIYYNTLYEFQGIMFLQILVAREPLLPCVTYSISKMVTRSKQ